MQRYLCIHWFRQLPAGGIKGKKRPVRPKRVWQVICTGSLLQKRLKRWGSACQICPMGLRLIVLFLSTTALQGQTCCSGGVPLSNNLGLPNEGQGSWQIGLTYDYNNLNTLKAGWQTLDDDARQRETHSLLINMGYAFSSAWSVEALLTWVNQTRTITQFENRNFTETSGIGDGVFLLKYALFNPVGPNSILNLGAGTKAPIGDSDLTTPDGLLITADLQPGSGAWDGIGWASLAKQTPWRPSGSLAASFTYRATGKNDAYLNNTATYEFGDELQATVGYTDQVFLWQSVLINPGIVLRYRKAWQDRIDDQQIPNTGGEWLFLRPEFAASLTPSLALLGRIELPLFSYVDGTQVTPTSRISLGIRFSHVPKTIVIQNLQL